MALRSTPIPDSTSCLTYLLSGRVCHEGKTCRRRLTIERIFEVQAQRPEQYAAQCQGGSIRLGGRPSMIDQERKASQSCTFIEGFTFMCMLCGRAVVLAKCSDPVVAWTMSVAPWSHTSCKHLQASSCPAQYVQPAVDVLSNDTGRIITP